MAASQKKTAPPKKLVITTRKAVATDVVALYEVLKRYFEDLQFAYPKPERDPTIAWGLTVIIKGGVIVAEADGKIIGSVGLEVDSFPWSPTVRFLNGLWFYVVPERRAGRVAESLMVDAKGAAEKMNMGLRLDNIFGIEPKLQDAWREKHGFKYAGGNHVWFPPAPKTEG